MLAWHKVLLNRHTWTQMRTMNTGAKQALQVLFCGEEFTWGFRFSEEALNAEPNIEARTRPSASPKDCVAEGTLVSLESQSIHQDWHACCHRLL